MSLPIHPDDVLLFTEVFTAMRMVAKTYELPLRSITGYPMPKHGMANRLGDCSQSGDIRLVLRCTVDGVWCEDPLSPDEVWDTAAHELSHLRHRNHGRAFEEFMEELHAALRNRKEDHKAKVLKKLVKLQNSRQGEAAAGNAEAAEAFASMINKMLLEHELNPSDIDYARASDDDPVIEMRVNLGTYKIRLQKTRIAWQETLAQVVADAHLCTFMLQTKSNNIWFVGTRSHATVAEYVYGTLVPIVDKLSDKEYYDFLYKCQREGNSSRAHGFRPAWLASFVLRIQERFKEARAAAVSAAPSETMALMRLSGALLKARKYTADKFEGKKGANPISFNARMHAEGLAAGKAAADRMVIGRKGVDQGRTPKGSIGDGTE